MNNCLLFAFTRFWHVFYLLYLAILSGLTQITILGVSSDKGNVHDRRGSSNYNNYNDSYGCVGERLNLITKNIFEETKGGGYVVAYKIVCIRLVMENISRCRLRSGTLAQHQRIVYRSTHAVSYCFSVAISVSDGPAD